MSCACENKRLSSEYDRIWKLAKMSAQMLEATVVIYQRPDGTYNFCPATDEVANPIIEYITQY